MKSKRQELLDVFETVGRAVVRREQKLKQYSKVISAKNFAIDQLPDGWQRLIVCSDGCRRTAEQRQRWIKNGYRDELSEMRASLRQKHCKGPCSLDPDKLCSCH